MAHAKILATTATRQPAKRPTCPLRHPIKAFGCLYAFCTLLLLPLTLVRAGPPLSPTTLVLTTDQPQAILAQAMAWQRQGVRFPEALVREAVQTALRPEAAWEDAAAAIQAFDLYKHQAWATATILPFAVHHASHIILNADVFARWHPGWTKLAITIAAQHAPQWILSTLPQLMTLDATWAKQLATTAAAAAPAFVFQYADVLLAIDPAWTQGLMQQTVPHAPRQAVRLAPTYLAMPWGPQIFATAALTVPRWTVALMISGMPERHTILQALQNSTNPALRVLAQIASSDYPEEVRGRMAVFAQEITDQTLSLAEAARLSTYPATYFHTLVTRKLAQSSSAPQRLDIALQEESSSLIQHMNRLFDQPDGQRFQPIASFTALNLYMLLAYGEEDILSTSYEGVLVRLLTRMRQEALNGEQLLQQAQEMRLRSFLKSAAIFHRLDTLLATISTPEQRWALLARSLRDLDRAPDIAVQAALAVEILPALPRLPGHEVFCATLLKEYQRVQRQQQHQATTMYGLLAAQLQQQAPRLCQLPELQTLAQQYQPHFPDLHAIPRSQLFQHNLNIQRYFFYNDEDGKQSFQSFMALYRSDPAWTIADHKTFVHLTSGDATKRLEIYANKPTDDGVLSQEIERLFAQRHVAPQVIVHRGHSPYVEDTIARLPETAVLVFLGNCGGYTMLNAVLNKAPQAHLITTRGIGSMTINDPLLKAFNTFLLTSPAERWSVFWQQAAARLGHNPKFADYVPPDRNLGAIFLRAYRTAYDRWRIAGLL